MNKVSWSTLNIFKINKSQFLLGVGATVLFCLLFKNTFVWLYNRWAAADSFYSHGFLIPPIFAWLYWTSRNVAINSPKARSDWIPMVGMVLSILVYFSGMFLTINFVSALGMILFIVFVGWYLLGGPAFRKRWVSFSFLFFMLPLPNIVLNQITMPMKVVVSKISVTILDLMSIPYIHKGFEIELSTGSMTIDNPCSGLRSLISFFAMAFIFAYLRKFEKWRTIVLFAATIPVALFCNILRVQFLLLVAFYWGIVQTQPGTAAHDYSGLVIFALGMGIFILIFDKLSK